MRRTLDICEGLAVSAHVLAPAALILFATGPLFYNDNAALIYFMRRAVQWFTLYGAFWGYDPTYAAGYPLSFVWNSNIDLQFLAVLLYPIPEYVTLFAATAGAVIIAPFCFIAGLRNFGLRGATLSAGIVLMLAYWWCGFPAVMLLLGMPSSILAMHLCFYTASLFYRFFESGDPGATALLYVTAPLCLLAHKSAIIMLGAPAAILFLLHFKKTGLRRIFHLAAVSALALAVNSFWLVPFLELVKYKLTVPGAPHGLCLDPLRFFKDYFTLSKIMGHKPLEPAGDSFLLLFLNTGIRDALLGFGIYGMVKWWRAGHTALSVFFASHTVFFLAEIYFGSFWSVSAALYPTRYIPNLDFMLAVPAATGLQAAWRALLSKQVAARRLVAAARPALLLFLVASALPYAIFTKLMDTRLDGDTKRLTMFLKDYTHPSGRILLEDSGWNDRDSARDGTPPKYGESQFPSLLADLAGREFIGGPYPYIFLAHHYASFQDGTFLRKPLAEFTPEIMKEELDRYFIRWIVCWSHDCRGYFSSDKSEYAYRKNIGRFDVFERRNFISNPFLLGSGYAIAGQDGINCFRVKPENGAAVLKYHALEHLTISGGGRTGAEKSGGDPVGFIRIDDPPDYFRIVNGYKKR